MGINTFDKDSVEVWHTSASEQFGKGWIGVFNRSRNNISRNFSKTDLGLREFILSYKLIPMQGNIHLYDIWNNKNIDFKEGCTLEIPADGVVFMSFERNNL